MYRVLIVDDEILLRVGLESIINWQEYGFEIAGTADSGEAAMQFIRREKLDVVLTDVVMPGMDGVELTRLIKKEYPHILVVALSCYTDVDYVKNIIKMGAEDYLQKLSMTPEHIVTVLRDLYEKLEARRNVQGAGEGQEACTSFLLRLFAARDEQAAKCCLAQIGIGLGQAMRVMAARVQGPSEAGDDLTETAMARLCTELMEDNICQFVKVKNGLVAGIIRDTDQAVLNQMGMEIVKRAERYLNKDVAVGFSLGFLSPGDARVYLRQADIASFSWYLDGKGRVFFFVPEDQVASNMLYAKSDQIRRLIDIMDFGGARDKALDLVDAMRKYVTLPVISKQIFTMLLTYVVRFSVEHGISLANVDVNVDMAHAAFDEIVPVEKALQLFLSMLSFANQAFEASPARYRPEIKRLMAYIQEHYMDDLTLSAAAAFVCMSESYLSNLFKRETGQSFVSYLEECRMQKAILLMRKSRLPLYMIAQQVGYPNVNYFGRVFKKIRGQSPRDYLRKQKNEQNAQDIEHGKR